VTALLAVLWRGMGTIQVLLLCAGLGVAARLTGIA